METISDKSLLSVLSELIAAYPEAVRAQDSLGNIPLHYAVAPFSTGAPAEAWKPRTAVLRLLITADSSSTSTAYLQRNNVDFKDYCSPLYRAVQTLLDEKKKKYYVQILKRYMLCVVSSHL